VTRNAFGGGGGLPDGGGASEIVERFRDLFSGGSDAVAQGGIGRDGVAGRDGVENGLVAVGVGGIAFGRSARVHPGLRQPLTGKTALVTGCERGI